MAVNLRVSASNALIAKCQISDVLELAEQIIQSLDTVEDPRASDPTRVESTAALVSTYYNALAVGFFFTLLTL
jgi:hypothetical protein